MTLMLGNLKLQVLSSICQIIDTALDLEKALSEVLRILSETLSMKRATITLADPENERLAITASHGLSREERQRGVYELDEGVTGLIFQTGKPYIVPDIRREPLFLDKTGSRHLERGASASSACPSPPTGAAWAC
jgi:Signal transduction protein containing GAF and PtsI domains